MDETSGGSGIGKVLSGALRLSSDEQFERDQAKEADRAQYRRNYWQDYSKRVKRVFGTLKACEYAAAKERADDNGRSVWGQIWAEACAYRAGTVLPTPVIAEQQRHLIAELRRIGNNINQLAKLGHIEARKHGSLAPRDDDRIGQETLRQFSRLESIVARFDDNIEITVQADHCDDH